MAVAFLPDRAAIDTRLEAEATRGPLAPVAPQAPLLANLSAWENVALVAAFHEGTRSAATMEATARSALARLGLTAVAETREGGLTPHQAFLVQLARAAMRPAARLVLVTPFTLVPDLADDAPITAALAALGEEREPLILDYAANRPRYRQTPEAP